MIDFLCSLLLFLRLVAPVPTFTGGAEGSAGKRIVADTIPSEIDFGEVAAGYRRDTVLVIPVRDTAGAGLIVTRENFGLNLSASRRGDSSAFLITSSYHPFSPGVHTDTVSLGPDSANRTILLRGTSVRSDLPFGGDTVVDLGSIPLGTMKDTVGSIGLGNLDLLRIDSIEFEEKDGPFTRVAPRIFPLALGRTSVPSDSIRVRAAGTAPGTSEGRLVIGTNMGTRRIRFRAVFTDSTPSDTGNIYLKYDSDTLDFGTVRLEASVVRRLTIANTRSEAVTIDTLFQNDRGAFSVGKIGSWDRIPPMDSASLRVVFVPQQSGEHHGRLTMSANRWSRTVHLLGTGTPAPGADTIYLGEVEMDSLACIDSTVAIPMRDSLSWISAGADSRGFTVETDPVLPSQPSDTLRMTVRFCWEHGIDSGLVRGNVVLMRSTQGEMRLLHVVVRVVPRRSMPRGQIVLLGDTVLRFNQVDTGDCAEQQILLVNMGDAPADLVSSLLDGGRGAFTLVAPPQLPRTLGPKESFALAVRFCPTEVGPASGEWEGRQDGAGDPLLRVVLRGTGREAARPEEPLLLLGDATVRVGETFRLPLSLDGPVPPNTVLESVRLVFNRRSLWFRNAFPAGSTVAIAGSFQDDSTLVLTGGGIISGTRLLDLEFIGLSTGRESNMVRVKDIVLTTLPRVRLDTAQVLLIGCEFVEAGGFTKKIAITGITADPLSSAVGISYDAPRGLIPSLSLIDISGARVMTRELPHGTGEAEFVQIPLGDHSPGLYLLELRAGNDRSAIPVMVRGK